MTNSKYLSDYFRNAIITYLNYVFLWSSNKCADSGIGMCNSHLTNKQDRKTFSSKFFLL